MSKRLSSKVRTRARFTTSDYRSRKKCCFCSVW